MKPTQGFCDVSVLLFEIHESIPQQECVFHQVNEHDTRNCIIEISQYKCDLARSYFNSILFISNVYSEKRQNTSQVTEVFDKLAGLLLCEEHAGYRPQLRLQWLREFRERRSEILSELEDYYGKPASSEGAEDDKTGELTRYCLNIDEEGVAEKVTKVLDHDLRPRSREMGCLYIISPRGKDYQGLLKIGYSKKHPQAGRLKNHERCFGDFAIIKIRPVTYAQRVEQLLLAEFSPVRYKKYCQECKRAHIEWLRVDKKTLVNSLIKWCDFFDNVNTYKNDGQFMTLPENGLKLPSPALEVYLKQKRPPGSTPSKRTPRGKSSPKDSASKGGSTNRKPPKSSDKKDTSAGGFPTGTSMETPTKTFRSQSSFSISPSYPDLKTPTTVTASVVSIPKTPDSVPRGSDVDQEDAEVGWLTKTFRRALDFGQKSAA